MTKTIYARDVYDEGQNEYRINVELPKICPYCKRSAIFRDMDGYAKKRHWAEMDGQASIIYMCPSCEKYFIVNYSGCLDNSDILEQLDIIPYMTDFEKVRFSEEIMCISEKFIEIYNQSHKAECQGLYELCGMGYRKSIEFLIKDYAIYIKPEEKERIGSMTLANCIQNYLSNNEKLKAVAMASTWLGNDETHYVRKHKDYGLEELKAFINALVTYIDSELQCEKAKKLIDSCNG